MQVTHALSSAQLAHSGLQGTQLLVVSSKKCLAGQEETTHVPEITRAPTTAHLHPPVPLGMNSGPVHAVQAVLSADVQVVHPTVQASQFLVDVLPKNPAGHGLTQTLLYSKNPLAESQTHAVPLYVRVGRHVVHPVGPEQT